MPSVDTILSTLPAWVSAGFGAGGGFFALKWFVDWVSSRVDKRESAVEVSRAQVDSSTKTLFDYLERQIGALVKQNQGLIERVDAVEAELEKCRAERVADQEELARLRGAVMGLGDARQQAAINTAADRLQDRNVAVIIGKIGEAK